MRPLDGSKKSICQVTPPKISNGFLRKRNITDINNNGHFSDSDSSFCLNSDSVWGSILTYLNQGLFDSVLLNFDCLLSFGFGLIFFRQGFDSVFDPFLPHFFHFFQSLNVKLRQQEFQTAPLLWVENISDINNNELGIKPNGPLFTSLFVRNFPKLLAACPGIQLRKKAEAITTRAQPFKMDLCGYILDWGCLPWSQDCVSDFSAFWHWRFWLDFWLSSR